MIDKIAAIGHFIWPKHRLQRLPRTIQDRGTLMFVIMIIFTTIGASVKCYQNPDFMSEACWSTSVKTSHWNVNNPSVLGFKDNVMSTLNKSGW